MSKKESLRPGWRSILLSTLITFCVVAAFSILPDLQQGTRLAQAVSTLLANRGFWLGLMLPIGVFYGFMFLLFPLIQERLIRSRGGINLSWRRNRWLVTVGGLVFILGTAVPMGWRWLQGGKTYPPQQLAFAVLMWLVYGGLIVYLWARQPSPEWRQGFETGDHRRSLDERYYLVLGKSAVSTLYWSLALLSIVGTLYDLLVTRSWPIRSLFEALAIFVLWNVLFARYNRRV